MQTVWWEDLIGIFVVIGLLVWLIACSIGDCTPLGGMIEQGQQPQVGGGEGVDGAVAMAMYGSMD
tara:strand:- start:2686 stop:2880 length:195 start_codon:yes stop_codon:yes gene_type:complete